MYLVRRERQVLHPNCVRLGRIDFDGAAGCGGDADCLRRDGLSENAEAGEE